jgi:translocation and assembly module TamA
LLAWSATTVAEVHFEVEGAERALLDNLRSHLALAAEPCDAPAWRVRRLFARAERDLEPALRAFGYYRARIDKDLEFGEDCWRAQLTVDIGERVRVRSRVVDVQGDAADDPALADLLSALPQAEGDPLHHGNYEEIKARLREFAAARGYLDFRLQRHELRVYPDESAAEIEIRADSGPRYRLGELRFGDLPFEEDFVRRLVALDSGKPYRAADLTGLDRRLSDSGYFGRVEVLPRRDEAAEGTVPIELVLEAAPRHVWRAGVGYATDTGPRLSLGYSTRYVNRRGHRFDSEMRLSPVESGLTADYLIPGHDPNTEHYTFGLRLLRDDTKSAESDSVTVFGRYTRRHGDWTVVRFLELLHESSEIGTERERQTLLMPGVRLQRTRADDLRRTHQGYRVSLELRGAHDDLLSSTTLLQLRGSAKGIHRFGDSGRITVRADAGGTLVDDTTELPASLRFFAGGDNSVRGYAYESLGPRDANGQVVGGRHLLVGSVEYEHPVAGEDWWGAAFVDAGNAFDPGEFEVKVGYGVGLRWYSPVGRVRLDLAFPRDTERDDWRLHFALGVDL